MPSRCYPYPCPGCRTPESVQAPDRYCGSCILEATVPVPGGATHRTDGTLRRTPFQRAAA